MFRFEDPIYLWLLLLVPVLVLVALLGHRKRKKQLKAFGDPELLKDLMPDVSAYRPWVKLGLAVFAFALLVVMLARPQMGTKITHEKRNGIEAVIAIDVSNSMMAQDVVPSRLEKSKLLIENLVDHFTHDRIGLVVFAGDAFVQLPITTDYVSAKMFLQNIDPSLVATQGTDIAKAINLSMRSFSQQKDIGKAVIVITDGEDHEGGALEAAKAANDKGVRVFILGIGSTKGAPIPLQEGGYLTDRSGQTVLTALNETMCKEIAQAGKGTYIHVDNTNDAQEKLNDELAKLQRADTQAVIYSEYGEQFQAVCIIVIILLIAEILILDIKNPKLRNIHLFGSKKPMTMLLLLIVPTLAFAQSDRHFIRTGNKLYRNQNYPKAEVEYRKAMSQNGSNAHAVYNLGNALMMQQKDSAAIVQLENAGKMEANKTRKAMAYHNIGTICQRHQLYGDAIKAYEEALRNNPNDNETRYNLALCKRLNKNNKEQQKQQQQQQQKEQQKEQKQKEKQQPKPKEQMSKENAEQLLNAAIQDEKATQQRLKKATQQPSRRTVEKNW
ncbi:MAG: VWA domain-containing protein [Prevotella shahii]|uniref:VWA domain-containing protein n=1 Tax=Hoylesella shahii TaxID=228603 RepID=UPI001CAAA777|nr:VWA domain-containing protein [Hoylesella shahii]MBF1576300.1 VWA domain-containing protein [Hoylesella shahii]MBF1590996.1 VWA domain-containing protein [Hoylesella shahii]